MLQQIMTKPGEIIFQEVPMPEVKEGQVLIKIMNIGICGSDIHVYHGEHPFTSYPVTQGHEVSGEIVEIGKDVKDFYVGHYGRFDGMAAKAVITAKLQYPEIKLIMLLPYHPFEQPIPTPKGFYGTLYPDGMEKVPKRFAIVRANQDMVKNSTHLIAYVKHFMGGSGRLLEYAQKREKKKLLSITNLAKAEVFAAD